MIAQSVYAAAKSFDAANGDDGIVSPDEQWILFSNGARREKSAYGVFIEPPASRKERVRNIIEYWETMLSRRVADFDQLKADLIQLTQPCKTLPGYIPGVNPDQVQQLKNLQREVKRIQAKITELREQLEKLNPEQQQSRDFEARRASEMASLCNELESIKV